MKKNCMLIAFALPVACAFARMQENAPGLSYAWLYPQMDMELFRVHQMRDDVRRAGLYAYHPGVLPPLRDKAHCHEAVPLPDGSGYCVVDLGLDELVEYPSGCVFKTFPAGAGPRHILFHPNGRLAFLISELGNLVTSLSWSPAEGFRTLDILPTIISRRDAETQSGSQNLCASAPPRENYSIAAAIRFTPDGRHVVVSNRGENSLVVFSFNEATGRLSFKSRTFLAGNWPRDFIFASDTLALVACERSGEVLAMRYHPSTGLFTQVAALGGLHRPVALTTHMRACLDKRR